MARTIHTLEKYIEDEEGAIKKYLELSEAVYALGEEKMAGEIFNIMVDEDRHATILKKIQKKLLGRERIR